MNNGQSEEKRHNFGAWSELKVAPICLHLTFHHILKRANNYRYIGIERRREIEGERAGTKRSTQINSGNITRAIIMHLVFRLGVNGVRTRVLQAESKCPERNLFHARKSQQQQQPFRNQKSYN